jgi:hypothetical protein
LIARANYCTQPELVTTNPKQEGICQVQKEKR